LTLVLADTYVFCTGSVREIMMPRDTGNQRQEAREPYMGTSLARKSAPQIAAAYRLRCDENEGSCPN
jgi:hypothetical protein